MITPDGKRVRTRMNTFKIGELSAVTRPAQKPALAVTTKSDTQENVMDPKDIKIAELEAVNKKLTLENALTDDQRAHYATLLSKNAQQAQIWLEKSHEQREIVLAEVRAADIEVYKCVTTGESIRKSMGATALAMAKQLDTLAEINKTNAATVENATYAKQAQAVLGEFPGSDEDKVTLIKALHKGIDDAKVRDGILERLTVINKSFADGTFEIGTSESGEEHDQVVKSFDAQYEALVAKTMETAKVDRNKAILIVSDSDEMAKLYADHVGATA